MIAFVYRLITSNSLVYRESPLAIHNRLCVLRNDFKRFCCRSLNVSDTQAIEGLLV